MTPDTQNASLASLLTTVKALKRGNSGAKLSSSEKAKRVTGLIDRLANYPQIIIAAQQLPITRNAEER